MGLYLCSFNKFEMRIQGGEYNPEPHEAPASVLPAFQVGPRRRSVFNVLHHLPDARLQLIRPLDGWRVQADSLIAVTFRDRICASDRSLLFNVRLFLLLSTLRALRRFPLFNRSDVIGARKERPTLALRDFIAAMAEVPLRPRPVMSTFRNFLVGLRSMNAVAGSAEFSAACASQC